VKGPEPQAFLQVRARPGSFRTEILGTRGQALVVAVAAVPEKGRANEVLLAFLAEQLGVARRNLELVAGAAGRDKLIKVHGLDRRELGRRLAGPGGPDPQNPSVQKGKPFDHS